MIENPVISISDLKMKYSEEYVLNGIDLRIGEGQIIGYIGPNGAGKTTTIRIMLGMLDSYEGQVSVLGETVNEHNIQYKMKIGYVPESGHIYENLTGMEYLEFIGRIYKLNEETILLRSIKMAEFFTIADAMHNRISSYSKGMKQKLLIISAIIHNPQIIFLDEPLNGLDANSVLIFKEVLTKLAANGKTIFYSSHLMDVVEKISNRIILIDKGKILADGTFEELKMLSEKGSLESIFNELTGFHKHDQIATEIVELLET
jgi:ABC-2 type transport system ATP-binding protein